MGDGWKNFLFASSYALWLTAWLSKYAILLAYQVGSGNASSNLYWMRDTSSPTYSGGNMILSTDNGSSFTAYTGNDMYFEEYGTLPITAPEITATAASNITQYEARLNSTVADDGNEACDIRFGYGTTSQTAINFASYDIVTDWVNDTYTTGMNPYVDIEDLTDDTTYYFRVQIRNSNSTVTSTDELTFGTLSSFTAPTNFRAITESTVINLFWTKGTGASTTMVRYKYGSYPTTTSDGILLYNSTASNTTHTGLTPGTTIYYSAWSISGVNESSAVNLIATTIIEDEGDINITDPTEPVSWFIEIDPTTLENFEPVYSTVNDIADSIDMPHSTFWFLGATFISVLAGFGVYTWRKSLLGAAVVMFVFMIVFSAVNLIPGFMIFLCFVVIVALGTAGRRFGL
jgi:hypothetical protein